MRLPSSPGTADEEANRRPASDRRTASERESESDRSATAESGPAARLAEGATGGLVATLVMTAYRLPVSRSLPPTARFWSKFVAGGRPDDHPVPAIALHLLYGAGAGAVFGLLAPLRNRESAPPETVADDSRADATDDADETAKLEAVGLLAGVGYALALSAFGERVLLERLLDADLDSDESLVFHAGHVVYGLSLGTWVGSRTGDRR